jgi:polysaccharide biosynthesis transport protein
LTSLSVKTAKALPESGLTGLEVAKKVSVSPEGESEILAVSATDQDPAFATTLANEFATQFVDFSREIENDKVVRAQKLAEAQFAGLSEGEQNGSKGHTLEQRILELETLSSIQTGRAEVAQTATEPESQSSPNTKKNVALGLVVGILLAIAAIFLREQLDRRIRTAEELEDLYGAPVVAGVPESKNGGLDDVAVSEAILMLRANLRYIGPTGDRSSLLLTSAGPEEGKTMVAWSLAQAEAAAGERVLLIEADMRRPSLTRISGTRSADGLGLVLAGGAEPADAIRSLNDVDVLAAGPPPPNPSELLDSKQMTKLLDWSEAHYDRVIIDTPPAGVVADAVPLFGKVGAVLVVGRLRQATRDGVKDLSELLLRLDAPFVGIVANGVPRPAKSSYYQPYQPSSAEEALPQSAVNGSVARPKDTRSKTRD